MPNYKILFIIYTHSIFSLASNLENNIAYTDPRLNSNLYDILVKDPVKFNGVIGNVGDILIKNKLINSTFLVFKYKLIYYSPSIIPSIVAPSLISNQTVSNTNGYNGNNSTKEVIFSIDAADGAIKLKVPSNYTTLEYLCKVKHACTCDSCIFNLNIIYSTRNKLNTNIVRVFIDDINKYAPEFYIDSQTYTVNISEASEIGDKVKLVNASAFDRDAYFNKITFILSYRSDLFEPVDDFKIEASDTESQNLNLIINSKVDYEKKMKYEFFLIAQDNGMPVPLKTSISLIINIIDENDNSPICDKSLFSVSIREHKRASNIIKIQANDADSGLNGKVEYYLRSSNYLSDLTNPNDDVSMLFDIDKETGWLSVVKPLDYKMKDNYLLTVKTKDMGAKNSYTTYCKVKIDVLDDNDREAKFSIYNYLNESMERGYYSSSFTSLEDVSSDIVSLDVYENNNVDMVLAFIRVFDNDTLGNYKFILNDEKEFKIIKRVYDNEYSLVTLVSFDHEKKSSYLLNLTLFDLPIRDKNETNIESNNVFTWNQLIRINILDSNDNPPKFLQNFYEYYVNENSFNVSINLKNDIEVYDKDSFSLKNNLIYKMIDSENTKASDYIVVSADSSTVPQLWLKKPFDFEIVGPVVEFDLQVIDKSKENFSDKTRVRVHVNNINDNYPIFLNENKTFIMHKNLPPGSYVGRIQIFDKDKNINETYSNISFRILDQKLDRLFHVCKNGIITNLIELDKQNKKLFELKVKAIDYFNKPILSSVGLFYIRLEDEVKDEPQFIFPKPGTHYLHFKTDVSNNYDKIQLIKVIAKNSENLESKLTYSMISSTNAFEIDSLTGIVYLKDYKAKSIHEVSIEIRNTNGFKNTNNFTIFLNYNENEISSDILMRIQMDMNEFNTSFIENEKNEFIEEESKTFRSSLRTIIDDTKNKNFFQLVSNSVLIVILLVVLAFMILIACFILVTAYKRALQSKKQQQSYSNKSGLSKTLESDVTPNGTNGSSLNSSKLSIVNCIAEVKSCLKSQFNSTASTSNPNSFNSLNKTALLGYYDTNGTRKSGDMNTDTFKITGETLKSNSTIVTTLPESPTGKHKNLITVKDAPISEIDKIIISENAINNRFLSDPNRKSNVSIGSVYNFNTKQISTIQYSTNTSNDSNLSNIDDLDSNCMISSNTEGNFSGNRLFPKLPYESTNISATLIKNLHNTNSNDNLMQYKEFLNQQAHHLMKKSSNLIAKATDLQNEFYSNSKRLDDFNANDFNSLTNSYTNASTPKNKSDIKKYYAHVVIPEHNMQSINGVPFKTIKNNTYNYYNNQNQTIFPNQQIDRHLQKFEKIYNDENGSNSKCSPPPGQVLSYTYTEF